MLRVGAGVSRGETGGDATLATMNSPASLVGSYREERMFDDLFGPY